MASIAARTWQAINVLITGSSLLVQIWFVLSGKVDVNSGASTETLPVGTRLANLFSYFTIQANILVLIAAIRLLIDPDLARGRDNGIWWRVVRLTGLLGIVITGIVYVTVLRPLMHPTGIFAALNAGLHYITPPLALIGWLIFGPRPRISWRILLLSMIWPIAWIIYTLIRGAITGWYPYPFMDVPTIGAAVTARNLAVITVLAVVLLLIMKAADRLPTPTARSAHPLIKP